MAPRIKVTGILSCDPSWRGLAFILSIPSLEYNRSFLYDLKEFDKSKQYRHPVRTMNLIHKIYDDMFQKEERMFLVDKVLMESQHKTNMQVLSWLLVANLLPRLGSAKVEYLSPLTCKRNFDIKLTGTHKGNKDAAEVFVETSKNRLVASETVIDHNTADACLVINAYLETTKNIIYKDLDEWSSIIMPEVDVSYSGHTGTKLICPKCKNASGVVRKCEDREKKNYGKHFLTCWWTLDKGKETEKRCGNFKALYENVPKIVNGYVDKTWKVQGMDDDEDVVEVGSKRPPAASNNSREPPAKKIAAAPAPVPTPGPSMPLTVGQFGTTLKRAVDALKEQYTTDSAAVLTRIEQLDAKIEAWTVELYHIRQVLDSAMGTEQQANQEQGTEDTEDTQPISSSGRVPPIQLEEGELETISF